MNLFDPSALLNAPIDAELATRRTPLPIGETVGQIMEVKMTSGTAGPNARNPGQTWYKLETTVQLIDLDYLAKAGKEKAQITYGLMLDLTESGTIAMGPDKNVKLGKLRAATGTNQPGKSLQDMNGRFVRVKIGHRPDEKDPSIVYDEIQAVAAA